MKHSGDFLYKISNEEDKFNFRVSKFRVPGEVRPTDQLNLTEQSPRTSTPQDSSESSEVVTNVAHQLETRLSGKHELMPKSEYLTARAHQLIPLSKVDEVTGLATVETIYEPESNETVQGVEVFQHYMAVLIEKNKQRQLKTVNLRTLKQTTHYFDSNFEVNPSDQ